MERALGSCKEENMICKVAKSSKGAMHWTRQSNEMNNKNSSKMRRISVCLYWTLISHYWSLLRNYYRIVYAQMFCRTFTCNSVNSQICCRSFLTLVSLSLTRAIVWSVGRRQFMALLSPVQSHVNCRNLPLTGPHKR